MNKKRKVTIFIPAYNEEHNIASIIGKLLSQNTKTYALEKIVVVDDGSTDNTAKIVRGIKSSKVKLISDSENLGKKERNNQFFEKFDGDILVQLDADSLIKSKNLIDNLIAPLLEDDSISMSCGAHTPLPPKTFAEKIAYFGVKAWERSLEIAGKPERYYCYGQIRAFTREFSNKLVIPDKYAILSEDIYSFYFTRKNNYKTAISWNAMVYFRLPASISDYRKQMKRFLSSPGLSKKLFGEKLTKKYDVLRPYHKVAGFALEFIRTPFWGIAYALLQLWTKFEARSYVPVAKWEVSQSTKNV